LDENHSKTADSYYGLGILSFSSQDCASAFVKQQNALTNGKKNLDEEEAKRADSLHHMASYVQRKLQNYELSLQLHQCALAIRLKLSALQSHQRTLDIRLELFGEKYEKTADSYNSLGVTQFSLNDLRSALQSHQRALDIRLELFGEKHEKTADSYHELGNTQGRMNDLRSALQPHQRALDIRLELFGETHEKTADSYRDLGVTQYSLNDLRTALQSH